MSMLEYCISVFFFSRWNDVRPYKSVPVKLIGEKKENEVRKPVDTRI